MKPKPLPSTLRDIARLAETSESTVSRVLSGRTKAVRGATAARAERIRAIADSLNFRPNWRARAFQLGRTHQVALVYSNETPWLGSVYADMLAGAVAALQSRDHHLIFFQATGNGGGWNDALRERRFDGCLVHHEFPPDVRQPIREAGLPCVLLNAKPAKTDALDAVYPDDINGAATLTSHLIELGHRRIWFCHSADARPPRHFSVSDRVAGYLRAMRTAGLAPRVWPAVGEDTDPLMAALPRGRQRPTALVVYGERDALKCLYDLHAAGLHVPRELSVATFNDTWESNFTIPPLTVMRLPFEAMGRQAADLMLSAIETPATQPRQIIFPETLVPRASTGPAPRGRRG